MLTESTGAVPGAAAYGRPAACCWRSAAFESERRAAFQQAQRRLAELERRSGWRLPRPAAAALEHRARGMLAAAGG